MISKSYTLDELCIFIRNGKSVKQSKDVDGLPITRIETIANQTIDSDRVGYAGLTEEEGKSHLLECGDILFSHINSLEHLCKTAIYTGFPEKLVHGMNLLCIRPNLQLIFPQYLLHLLRSSRIRTSLLQFANKSVNQASISAGNLKSFVVNIPPLAEQRRIASILDQADELRQKRQQAIEKLDQLLQATFIDMFGDPVSNPKGWEIFKSKALFQDPPRIGTTTPANGEGIPVVRVGELGQFYIDFEKCGRVQISESDFKKYELKNGDLVLARAIGSKNQLGKCSYFSEYFEPVCIDSHVMRLRPDSEKMHPLWFYFLLSSDQGKKILQSKGGATAVQFNINSAQANDLDIALPPLSEQAKFVEIANKILKNKDSHIKSLEKNNLLFSSLQNQAFNGTL